MIVKFDSTEVNWRGRDEGTKGGVQARDREENTREKKTITFYIILTRAELPSPRSRALS